MGQIARNGRRYGDRSRRGCLLPTEPRRRATPQIFRRRGPCGLKKYQFNFLRYAFSDGRVGRYTGKPIYHAHKRLIEELGLNTTHFDYVAENLVSTLNGLNVPQPIIDRVIGTVGPLRQIFDEATQELATREWWNSGGPSRQSRVWQTATRHP